MAKIKKDSAGLVIKKAISRISLLQSLRKAKGRLSWDGEKKLKLLRRRRK